MKLSRCITMMCVMTMVALIYIHMQMQIFNLAYEGKYKEKQLMDLVENNELMTNTILSLKSANHLGAKFLQSESELQFRDNGSVIQLVTTGPLNTGERVNVIEQRPVHPLLSFLSLHGEAEARAAERKDVYKPWRRIR